MDPIIELVGSRETQSGESPTAKLIFMAWGTEDEPTIRALALQYLPTFYEDSRIQLVRFRLKHLGAGRWMIEADYGAINVRRQQGPDDGDDPGKGDPLDQQVSVEIGGVTQHVTQALRTVASAKDAGDSTNLPDYGGAIGVSREGGVVSVKGCDILVPEVTWSEAWTIENDYVDWQYLTDVSDLVGRVNDDVFRTFPAGEVMFLGMTSQPFGEEDRRNVYRFKRSPNVTGYKLTPTFGAVDKKGWQYVWVDYMQSKIADKSGLQVKPRAIYVAEVGRPGLVDGGGNATNLASFDVLTIGS